MKIPNEDHRALLRGEIDADEYVRRVKCDVDARLDIVQHKPEPQFVDEETIRQVCRFCGIRIQRRGLLRRWRHAR